MISDLSSYYLHIYYNIMIIMQNDCEIRQGDLAQYAEGNLDLNDLDLKFNIVTGTPPYFPSKNGALPLDAGRGQCAFECRGGIEVYIETCSKLMSDHPASRFFVCQTYLEVKRTERSATKNGMKIIKRLDVYGKVGLKDPLFCVFSMKRILPAMGESVSIKDETIITSEIIVKENIVMLQKETELVDMCLMPYEVIKLYVRRTCGCHTADYDIVMSEMGRPLSTCLCTTIS